jgi:hypothetical protein
MKQALVQIAYINTPARCESSLCYDIYEKFLFGSQIHKFCGQRELELVIDFFSDFAQIFLRFSSNFNILIMKAAKNLV